MEVTDLCKPLFLSDDNTYNILGELNKMREKKAFAGTEYVLLKRCFSKYYCCLFFFHL